MSESRTRTKGNVPEEILFQKCQGGDHARALAICVEAVKLDLGRDHVGHVLRVRGRAGTAAVNVGRNVVDLCAVLIRNNRAFRRARIGAQHNAVLENNARNRRAGLDSRRRLQAKAFEHRIAINNAGN